MIPDYLIIEEQRRRERELEEQSRQMPLRIPMPPQDYYNEPEPRDSATSTSDVSKRGACIIDLNTYDTTRI